MLPVAYQLPAAIVFLIGGILATFFGYRLFRMVLAFGGFIIGALLASSIFGMSDTTPMLIAALVGGIAGAAVLFFAYYIGVALTGAVLGAVIAHLAFAAGDRAPHFLAVVFLAVLGAAAAMYLQRYFIIVGTGFGGAWTMIIGAMALVGDRAAQAAAAANDVWVVYPLNPAPGREWVTIIWVILGAIGTGVQLGITGGEKGRVVKRKKKQ
jgi:hypothetical protein